MGQDILEKKMFVLKFVAKKEQNKNKTLLDV